MDLTTNVRPASTHLHGEDTVDISSGQTLSIETSPGGEEILTAVVPVGKRWVVNVSVVVEEFDE